MRQILSDVFGLVYYCMRYIIAIYHWVVKKQLTCCISQFQADEDEPCQSQRLPATDDWRLWLDRQCSLSERAPDSMSELPPTIWTSSCQPRRRMQSTTEWNIRDLVKNVTNNEHLWQHIIHHVL